MSTMPTRPLGDGPQVSAIGLGGNNFGRSGSITADQEGTDAVLDAAVEAGITLVDTAELYNAGVSEQLIGNWLKRRHRDDILVATKFGHRNGGVPGSEGWGPKGSAGYIRKACEGSLARLGTDHIDLYQQHTPDPSTPIAETLGALDDLVKEGKVRAIGHSNFSSVQMRTADQVARDLGLTRFVSAQDNYSLLARDVENSELGAVRELGLGFLPYFPLASGLLTGKYTAGMRPRGSRLEKREDVLDRVDWRRLDGYRALCDRSGVSMLELSLGWLLSRDGVSSVIAGATRPDQVVANAAAAQRQLGQELLDEVTALFS